MKNDEELMLNALRMAKEHYGKTWRDELAMVWSNGRYPYKLREVSGTLQRIRNTIGPSGLYSKEWV